ncbi:hypothetical protein PAECIP111893_05302 [Paenibacillus plantiphilus]|uniref:DUF624 domain-containing protein n=1 Tax=Paenibacillus plantiphilus TaxID=2905650 RepID=A0ABM9CY46_9BACL|nr:DUF624 domain-containing protein [Paenibacillus plantiphilus]CAH1225906.1 hypothetical protein PAECIP111893_05302 [Paenibacillus plantiphilus]
MEMKGMMGGLYKISEWIMRLFVINITWILCSAPYILLLGPVFTTATESHGIALILSSIVAPFTLFPATAAMFAVARKWVMGETDVPLLRTFFRGYKENYKQSMIGGIVFVLLLGILIADMKIYWTELQSLKFVSYLFIGLLILISVSLINFFSMVVHYHMKTRHLLRNAVLLTIGRPIRTLSTIVMCGVIIFISFSSPKLMFIIPFFSGSLIAVIAFWNFYSIYLKLQLQAEKAAEAAAEAEAEKVKDESGENETQVVLTKGPEGQDSSK